MTLNGRTALYCKNDASFGAHHGNLKKIDPHCQRHKCSPGSLLLAVLGSCGYFWRFHGEGLQTTLGWSQWAIFSNFGCHIFGTFGVEANVIMQRCEVPYRLSSNRIILDLE